MVPHNALATLLANAMYTETLLREFTALIQQDIAQTSLLLEPAPSIRASELNDLADTRVSKHGVAFPFPIRMLYSTHRVKMLKGFCHIGAPGLKQLIEEARKGWKSAALIERWLLESAIAATRHDPDTTAGLTLYLRQPRYEAHARAFDPTSPAVTPGQSQDPTQSSQSPHQEMALLFQKLAGGALGRRPHQFDVICILRELIQLATYACAAIEKVLPDFSSLRSAMSLTAAENHAGFLIDRICHAIIAPFDTVISNPSSGLSLPLRALLQTIRPEYFVVEVLKTTFPHPQGMHHPTLFSHVEFVAHKPEAILCVYRTIVQAAVSPDVDIDGTIRKAVDDYYDDSWKADSHVASPASFRPPQYRIADPAWLAQVQNDFQIALTAARANVDHFDEEFGLTEDVPLVAVGPDRVPSHYSSPTQAHADDDLCTICMEDFSKKSENRCMKLHSCGHLFHEECLHGLINMATQNDYIQCPYCRRNICESRLVRGLAGNAATDAEA
ncbi:hypothetical protein SLS60_011308 [Paraconiothyrium brasiliense]|uniref:RING-type domain-containing protein n=1 Tax=Paraconiothyrium brasiliense TaxID=300254 RepID=A0ABR3QJB6_9PLEO